MHLAAEKNDPELLRLMLSHASAPEITDAQGNTPLHYAAGWGRVENVRLLLAAGARQDRRNRQGQTALEVAEESGRKRTTQLLREKSSSSSEIDDLDLHGLKIDHRHRRAAGEPSPDLAGIEQ